MSKHVEGSQTQSEGTVKYMNSVAQDRTFEKIQATKMRAWA
jgi:hypothetical protein